MINLCNKYKFGILYMVLGPVKASNFSFFSLINTSNLRNNLAIVQNDSFDTDNYFDNTCSREH